MNTKLIMTLSAVLMGLTGILLSFLPDELSSYIPATNPMILQILGAIYFGFAMMNWMSKGNLIGGIYNRPLAIGNFTHFFIAALALIKIFDEEPNLFKRGHSDHCLCCICSCVWLYPVYSSIERITRGINC